MQYERVDCPIRGNELLIRGNELLIRENGLHNSIYDLLMVFFLKISMSLQGFRTPMTNCKRFECVVVSRCTFEKLLVYLYQIKYMYLGPVEEEDVYNAHFMTTYPVKFNVFLQKSSLLLDI